MGVVAALVAGALSVFGVQPTGAQEASRGPDFCRSGAGHPNHGRVWCARHGYTLGSSSIWNRAEWPDASLRVIRRDRTVSQGVLADVVGPQILERLEEQRRRLNLGSALSGRWLSAEAGGVILQVYAGRIAVAELADWDGDGRVDLVLLNAGLRQDDPRNGR